LRRDAFKLRPKLDLNGIGDIYLTDTGYRPLLLAVFEALSLPTVLGIADSGLRAVGREDGDEISGHDLGDLLKGASARGQRQLQLWSTKTYTRPKFLFGAMNKVVPGLAPIGRAPKLSPYAALLEMA
jgi:hypothetical protein